MVGGTERVELDSMHDLTAAPPRPMRRVGTVAALAAAGTLAVAAAVSTIMLAAASSAATDTHAHTAAENAVAITPQAADGARAQDVTGPGGAAPAADLGSRFTLAVLPDTQFYSRYDADFQGTYSDNPFDVQTRFIADHADELNIAFVTHLGDVVDQERHPEQWQAADRAMSILEAANVPYSIAPGNHDVLEPDEAVVDTDYDLTAEPFLQTFGPTRAAAENASTYRGSDPTGLSQYHVFSAEGQQFLVLALTWRASDATIAWANDVIAAHPTLPVILTTHQLIDIRAEGSDSLETDYGLKLWDELIAPNDQVFLTLNGHFHGTANQTKLNEAGHPVTQVVIDWQLADDGGDGYLGLYEFDLGEDRIRVQTPSPWVAWKQAEGLTGAGPAFLTGADEDFTIPLDFADRFAGFDPDWAGRTVSPTEPDLYLAAKDVVAEMAGAQLREGGRLVVVGSAVREGATSTV
ncbi:metallophosphoesterase [Actinotalea sp. M2MS4P-6]|uniref:metallophosphoesterase n=1 Tax=Actinotalea sp. M2MS4P-6 TaxID=2983762 RepID=UPI0021E3988E|nr:metallophosphoesterase [Actinotalea sp. M2MS4P-6]MCV2394482.1 metallophosphoesterase [Actinotalea sp. M2MS4P-6]